MIKVNAITCPVCEYTVFSRARHDFRHCFCGKVAIDGGFDYVNLCFSPEIVMPEIFEKEIPQEPMELYNDWNERRDIFGLIPPVFNLPEEDKTC